MRNDKIRYWENGSYWFSNGRIGYRFSVSFFICEISQRDMNETQFYSIRVSIPETSEYGRSSFDVRRK